ACPGPGDTLLVRSGVYDEQVSTIPSGTTGNPVLVKSEVQYGAIVRRHNLGTGDFTVVLDRKHDIIIDGFVFDAQLQSTYHILMTIDTPLNDTSGLCHDIEIRNNEIANAYRDSQVGSDSQGIGTGNNCTNLWIHHNIIHDIGTDLIGTSGTHVGGYAM